MKTAFGILALSLGIPLAIVASQMVVAHETAMQQGASRTVTARAEVLSAQR